ncbi:MAG: M48 family metallopeptidase, partial [Candidatus Aenigmatarchaeota archaeon]
LKNVIGKAVSQYSKKLSVKAQKIYIRKQNTKWASCSKSRNLSFNIRLFFLPEKLINYVVFHEMVHLKERKHNFFFWSLIEKEFKDYKKMEKKLLNYWFYLTKIDKGGEYEL